MQGEHESEMREQIANEWAELNIASKQFREGGCSRLLRTEPREDLLIPPALGHSQATAVRNFL